MRDCKSFFKGMSILPYIIMVWLPLFFSWRETVEQIRLSKIDIAKSPKLFTSAKERSFSLRTLKRYITFATVKHSIHPFKTKRKGLIYVGTIISQPGLS